jgi:hypothetical protein
MVAKPADRVRVSLISAERLLGSLSDRSIDLLITDPPYTSINRSPTSGSHLRYWFADGLTWPQIGRVFALARRKLKADGVLMAMTNNDGLREAIGAMERAGFIGIRTITWDRQYPGLGGGLRHQCEFIVVGRLPGSRTLAGVDLVSVAAVGPGTAGRYPTSKPDGLGRELAAMAGIGSGCLVVDPFCGSGALLVGAAERGATVVAGDVAKRAVDLASARLTAAVRTRSGKRNGSSRSATAAPAAKSARSRGSSGSTAAAVRAKSSGSSGRQRSATAAPAAESARSHGSSGSTAAAVRTRSGKPNGSSRSAPAAPAAKSGGSSRKPLPVTAATRARSTGSSRKSRPGMRP